MQHKPATAPRDALFRLLDLARGASLPVDALTFALAWLAVAKLISTGRLEGLSRIEELQTREGRFQLTSADLAPGLVSVITKAIESPHADGGFHMEASWAVSPLIDKSHGKPWGLQDAAWWATGRGRGFGEGVPAYDPGLCDLIVGSLDIKADDVVWVPFDASGQLVVRLARAGARVWRAGPSYFQTDLCMLLLALEDEASCLRAVQFGSLRSESSQHEHLTHCLVTAPLGYKVPTSTEWRQWEQVHEPSRRLWVSAEEMDRSDAWAVAAMWPMVSKRGVFLSSPSLLFAQGQEHRLRKSLLLDAKGNSVSAAISLPSGVLSHTVVAPTLLVLDANPRPNGVRMIDVSGSTTAGEIQNRFGKDINTQDVLRMLSQEAVIPQLAENISVSEIEAYDFSLMPPRYLRRVEDLAGNRKPLGDLIATHVRSPVPSKDVNAWPVWEISIPMLDRWRPIQEGYDRWMTLTSRRAEDALLQEGDLVLSIKGTIGKVGIVGQVPATIAEAVTARLLESAMLPGDGPKTNAAVAAASCVALRVDRQKVLPEYLLLYMRSDDFKRQLEALRVGATIAHITPSTLLASVQVPVIPLQEQAAMCTRYSELQEMEAKVERIQLSMAEIRDQLFRSTDEHH